LKEIQTHAQLELIPGLLVVYTNMDLPNGPGISQRAAAARSQTVWRWLVQLGWAVHCASTLKLQAASLTAGEG